MPHTLTRQQIHDSFLDGWRVDSIEAATCSSTSHLDGIAGWLTALTRT